MPSSLLSCLWIDGFFLSELPFQFGDWRIHFTVDNKISLSASVSIFIMFFIRRVIVSDDEPNYEIFCIFFVFPWCCKRKQCDCGVALKYILSVFSDCQKLKKSSVLSTMVWRHDNLYLSLFCCYFWKLSPGSSIIQLKDVYLVFRFRELCGNYCTCFTLQKWTDLFL